MSSNNNNKKTLTDDMQIDEEEVLMMQAAEEAENLAYAYATNGTEDLSEDEMYLVMESLLDYFNYEEELHDNKVHKKAFNI